METALDTPADTLPQPQGKITPGVYLVIYDSEDGIKIQELDFKRDVVKFVNSIESEQVLKVYQGAKPIELQTKLTF